MLTYKIYPRIERINKKGLCPIYVQVTDNRETNRFKLDLSVEIKHFDLKKNKAKASMTSHLKVNSILNSYEQKANDIIIEYTFQKKPLSYLIFKNTLLGSVDNENEKDESIGDFYAFIQQRLRDSNFEHNTHRSYNTLYNLLQEYSPRLKFTGVTYKFIIGFRNFLANQKNNVENSRNKKMSQLRALIYEAMRQGYMQENPFKQIPLRQVKTHRLFLEIQEVEQLQTLYDKGTLKEHEQAVLQYFLFACYTGLRYSDTKQFHKGMINNDKISIKAEKTNETVVIPVIEKAKALLPKTDDKFNVISNQKTNASLKVIMEKAEIKKAISFHCARHTFATVGISSGIPLEVISKLLGHTDLKTTLIYAKIMDDVKVEAMGMWGKKKA